MEAGSEQALVKERGGSSLSIRTPEDVCFARSGGVMRVTEVLGLTCGLAGELVWTCSVAEGT